MPSYFAFSEDTKERIIRSVAVLHNVVHYGWVPFVLYVGYTRSTPQPSLIKCVPSRNKRGQRVG